MQYIILIGDEKLTVNTIQTIEHYNSVNSYNVPENYEKSELKKFLLKNYILL